MKSSKCYKCGLQMRHGFVEETLEYGGLTEVHQAPTWVCDKCGAMVCDGADMAATAVAMLALKTRAQAAEPQVL